MPKIRCKCGEVLRFGDIPCDIEYKFISDVEYDQYQGQIDAEELYLKMKSFLECKICGRLWFFWNGFENPPKEYELK
ncbi:hypothetical protein A3844_25600 [Paenibacillus helianthi]|uniref:CxxH/CxxC protein n=1 Tax=Paenibacillus helianthi TaxID=1349432 RepID=A0ABX3EIS9_9BACL|nr:MULTISPECIES: hypothetical protein [Paenibacillus]OKP81706.1 hypothetical protein A3844_25600 [Paenibacillus helianthi]OKP93136.1 hypothetical protein A3842_00370 [Paenibacillus sp. P3E]